MIVLGLSGFLHRWRYYLLVQKQWFKLMRNALYTFKIYILKFRMNHVLGRFSQLLVFFHKYSFLTKKADVLGYNLTLERIS